MEAMRRAADSFVAASGAAPGADPFPARLTQFVDLTGVDVLAFDARLHVIRAGVDTFTTAVNTSDPAVRDVRASSHAILVCVWGRSPRLVSGSNVLDRSKAGLVDSREGRDPVARPGAREVSR